VDADGELVARAPLWEEGLMVVDLDLPAATSWLTGAQDAGDGTTMTVERVELSSEPLPEYDPLVPGIAVPLDEHAEVWGALVTATRDYVEKNRFRSVVLGLSGGIDSALVATIACDALGPSGCTSSGCRASGARTTPSPTPRTGSEAGPALVGRPIGRWSTRGSRRSRSPAWRWRTCRPGCAARR
jgi:hypothetical protein